MWGFATRSANAAKRPGATSLSVLPALWAVLAFAQPDRYRVALCWPWVLGCFSALDLARPARHSPRQRRPDWWLQTPAHPDLSCRHLPAGWHLCLSFSPIPTGPAPAILGPGGWGALLIARDGDTVLKEPASSKAERPETTNNRMELLAAIHALEALDRPSTLTLDHRQQLRQKRHHLLAVRLEEKQLAHRQQETGKKRRPLAQAG